MRPSALTLHLSETDDPQWLVPGVFYGENRPEACTQLFPRFTPARRRRADGVATPGRSAPTAARRRPCSRAAAGSSRREVLAARAVRRRLRVRATARRAIWLDFPYREEPLRYDGSDDPAAPDVQTHRWQPGDRVELARSSSVDGDWRRAPATS